MILPGIEPLSSKAIPAPIIIVIINNKIKRIMKMKVLPFRGEKR
jgi:hypothetical protein